MPCHTTQQTVYPVCGQGLSPCVLRGQAGAGFEIFYDPSNAVAEEDEEDFWEVIGTNDYCLSLVGYAVRTK